MASTEIQLLKFIWENKGASWLRIVKELRWSSPDYSRLICQSLIKNKFIEFSEGQYKITGLGKRELMKLGLIEKIPKVEKVAKPKPKHIKRYVLGKKPRKPKKLKKPEKIVAKPKHIKRYVLGEKEIKGIPLTELSGLTPKLIEELKKKGFRTLEDIVTTSVVKLKGIGGLTLGKAAKIINEARNKLRKEGKEYLWEK